MKPILSAAQMKEWDSKTIEQMGVPSLVLMERAALAVCNRILHSYSDKPKIGIFAGPGNNGGDGIAIARILHTKGYPVKAIILGDSKKFSPQLRQELEIAGNYGVDIVYPWNVDDVSIKEFSRLFVDCDILIDSMFGIGLTRGLEGDYAVAAEYINQSGKTVIAVDIPSGYDTDSGKLLGTVGVKADTTVTFAYMKKGLVLGDCKLAAGSVYVSDVGIYCKDDKVPQLLDDEILSSIPKRESTANKGTCGKVLVIAGSESIYGACYLAANAALVTGSGLVKIYTHQNNIESIQQALPETMYKGYTAFDEAEVLEQISWADAIVIGPGLGTSEVSAKIIKAVSEHANVPVIVDADGVNLLAKDLKQLDELAARVPVILTPHLKEMERLCNTPVNEINYNMENVAKEFASKHNCVVVLKNHTTVIATVNTIFYCNSGNEGLATPGSGDVLAGIIGALLGQGLAADVASSAGAYIHGKAGTIATEATGIKGLLARDIIANINKVI
ncbi:bifunctional ADP-dependent NAD(P)H-hydrate dehydratase/NAD(P)H-hydrate epimerase [Pseudobutyrivibrio xylanivorans]|uniref:Bifunctional NAD(P)H-hydrate repair enzyme n=1 Tax=Pseudobutyrivibrio xylanivorans DSM 14809 TaxID=1123012 RepID=A0A1M6L4X4_PSEXY|nr:bifunctional ADP-dependent NAD(P)H-hydrate dehydratase/NAD(P)H-hydrate epimerase [Pseudobutyrivibrio xylanivorans]SHJ66271.1 NAD(P)H-hydrate epimerase [Pseudobutyrivibrio xylanivorans DSM 14809]